VGRRTKAQGDARGRAEEVRLSRPGNRPRSFLSLATLAPKWHDCLRADHAAGQIREWRKMKGRSKLIAVASTAVTVIGIGAGVGLAAGGDDDKPLRGSQYERAVASALEHVGEGTVTEAEDDDGAAFSVRDPPRRPKTG